MKLLFTLITVILSYSFSTAFTAQRKSHSPNAESHEQVKRRKSEIPLIKPQQKLLQMLFIKSFEVRANEQGQLEKHSPSYNNHCYQTKIKSN